MNNDDSPFSITANVAGLLTFLVAITAAVYARLTYLRNGDEEYIRVKTSLSWYKTESKWLCDLVAALGSQQAETQQPGGFKSTEYQMYSFVMDDLINLERRLLDIIVDIEAKASSDAAANRAWTVVLSSGRPSVAVAWLAVRSKAMELVRQREGLTARVQFLQLSMMSSRLREVENRLQVTDNRMRMLLEQAESRGHPRDSVSAYASVQTHDRYTYTDMQTHKEMQTSKMPMEMTPLEMMDGDTRVNSFRED